MKRTRPKHSAAFKTKVDLAAIKGTRRLAELASEFGGHSEPDLQLEKAAAGRRGPCLYGGGAAEGGASAAKVDVLYRQIGQLTVENDLCEGFGVKGTHFSCARQ